MKKEPLSCENAAQGLFRLIGRSIRTANAPQPLQRTHRVDPPGRKGRRIRGVDYNGRPPSPRDLRPVRNRVSGRKFPFTIEAPDGTFSHVTEAAATYGEALDAA